MNIYVLNNEYFLKTNKPDNKRINTGKFNISALADSSIILSFTSKNATEIIVIIPKYINGNGLYFMSFVREIVIIPATM